jgi:hypothetical protein
MGSTPTGKQKLAVLAASAVAVTGGGAAIAASGSSTPTQDSNAVIDAAAQNLGVTPAKLSEALKAALVDRVDAKLKAGTITEAQATALKARINSDSFVLFGGGFGEGPGGGIGHHGADLATVASYLGVTQSQLRTDLQSGTSLAEVAQTTEGKSVDGLIAAIVAAEKDRLAKELTAGTLTEAQQTQLLAGLDARVTDFVNGVRPAGGPGGGPGGVDGGTPPSAASSDASPSA